MTGKDKEKQSLQLSKWQGLYDRNKDAYQKQFETFNRRDALYRGEHKLQPMTQARAGANAPEKTCHVWNIIAENVESEIDSSVPMPKVTARRKKDEERARIVENMLRNELDRLPMEELNDAMERYVPVQGAGAFLVEWDNTARTHDTVGEVVVSAIHPKQLVPQDGVYTGLDDMDYFFMVIPQTKEYIRRKYGVEVFTQSESQPEVKSPEAETADDMVTQIMAYYHNDNGGIGLFSWVNDTVVCDMEDYQARRVRRCRKCGMAENSDTLLLETPTMDGTVPDADEKRPQKGVCPFCGGKDWDERTEDYEDIYLPMDVGGVTLGGAAPELDEYGNVVAMATAQVPYYKPDVFPIVLQKNISVFGQLLGESDVDKIADQQNTINRMEQKIIDRMMKAGTRITLPDSTDVRVDERDAEVWRIGNAADKNLIGVYDFKGDLEYELTYLGQVYEEARRVLGITDSFQGRADTTAKSGVAKEFAAAQSAGRLESKRNLKRAAYQRLYERIFKFKLAYADEPRPVVERDERGNAVYDEFSRYDFLEQDEAGQWHWVDDFIFDCDDAASLARNRPNMWKEITAQFQAGTFGDPTSTDTLILYWTKMEMEHYPGAGQTKKYLEDRRQQEIQMQQQQLQLQQSQQDAQMLQQVDEKARQDAEAAVAGG